MNILRKVFFSQTLIHSSHDGHSGIAEFLSKHLGVFGEFIENVILHAIGDVLPLIPFLFLTYLLMEFIEHKSGERTERFLKRSGKFGPLLGGAVGIIPQCGFSAVASNLYCTKIITAGTLISVFLSTSDEMLPILISNPEFSGKKIIFILLYKLAFAIMVGFIADLVLFLIYRKREKINIDELCDNDNCHCERGIFYSALHHTLKISLFIFICTIVINTAIFFIGEENLSAVMYGKPFISHLIAAIFGLIPNCAASVALTKFYTSGFITLGTMLSGLFSASGVGLLVLLRINRHKAANITIIATVILAGLLGGLLADLINLESLIS